MGDEHIIREEFEHLIAEIEAFKDNYMDEITRMAQQIEIMKDQLEELREQLKETGAITTSQTKLM